MEIEELAQIEGFKEILQASIMDFAPKLGYALLYVFFGILIAKSTARLLIKFENGVIKNSDTIIDDLLFPVINKSLIFIIYSVTVVLALGKVGVPEKYVMAIVILAFGFTLGNLLDKAAEEFQKKVVSKTDNKLDDVVFPLFRKILKYSIFVAGFVIAADAIDLEIVPIIAGMGIAGIAIGFAAKDTLSNIIAGIFIIIDRPFIVGDRIEVWNAPKNTATWGDVIDIGLRTTKIRTTDHIVIIIPNSEISRRDIINYTTISPQIRVRVPVGVSYDTNLKEAQEILINLTKDLKGVSPSPPPKVVVKTFGDSSIILELRVWINNAKRRRDIHSELNNRIKEAFEAGGIEIPFPITRVIMENDEENGKENK